MTTWHTLPGAETLPDGRVQSFDVGDRRIALCNVGGTYYAIADECTHDGAPLDQGELEGCEIECPRHGARFDVRSGKVTQLPAWSPVETYPVRVEDGAVQVGLE